MTEFRAFSSVETVESMSALKHGSLVALSVQQTLDCSYNYDWTLYGCSGGDTCTALKWMLQVFSFSCRLICYHSIVCCAWLPN